MLTRAHLYNPSAALRISGADANSFLQGQFTNDLSRPIGSATYGLWLNQKGKVLADSFVLRTATTEFLVVSSFSPAATIRQRLEAYIIADEVEVRDETSAWEAIEVSGSRAAEISAATFGSTPQPGTFLGVGEALVFNGRASGETNFTILLPPPFAAEQYRRILGAGAIAIAADTMNAARISDGLPTVPEDIGPGDLPNEGGLDETAISFTKGCYLGQEVMARLKNLGQVRRRLHVVKGSLPMPQPASEVFQNGTRVGAFRSMARQGEGFVAFAMLSLSGLDSKAGLSLSPDGPTTIRVISRT